MFLSYLCGIFMYERASLNANHACWTSNEQLIILEKCLFVTFDEKLDKIH